MPEAQYHLYKRERRRRWPYIVAAAFCVAAVVVGWQLIGVPRVSAVTPGPDAFVKNPALTVVIDVKGLPKLEAVQVSLDGKDVTGAATLTGNQLAFTTGDLADGPHSVSFTATSSNLLRHKVRKTWQFTVDTSIPRLRLDGAAEEGRINTSPATFSGKTEPFATVTIVDGAITASGTADASGKYSVSVKLPDGGSSVTITTTDRAGNATAKQLHVFVDAEPPVLRSTKLAKVLDHAGLTVRIKATDQLGAPKLKLYLDGEQREYDGPVVHAKFRARNLAQGRHKLVVKASDKGGNVVTHRQTFIVDSTEDFGSATLWHGARGKDVKVLQRKLAKAGVYRRAKTGYFDHATETAVRKLQAKYGLVVDGIVGGNVLNALSGQIVVDIGDLHLYLYRDGKLVKSYPVATGQAAYPTPTGSYAITSMQMNPTWLPPNSDWAKDAKPIPPGIDNPLGTRWIGTSASGVGIHGTPDDASIGTYASHGCIRMHIYDVEDLYERVSIGMPVTIRP